MAFTLVSLERLPKLEDWFAQAFGVPAGDALFYPGSKGTGWEGASLQGVIFHVFEPGKGGFASKDQETAARAALGGKPGHVLRITCDVAQTDVAVDFVRQELLPRLADVSGGAFFDDAADPVAVAYRAKDRADHPREAFELLLAEQRKVRSLPPTSSEDWSDL